MENKVILLIIFLACFVLVPIFFIKAGWKAKENIHKPKHNREAHYFIVALILYFVEIASLLILLKPSGI